MKKIKTMIILILLLLVSILCSGYGGGSESKEINILFSTNPKHLDEYKQFEEISQYTFDTYELVDHSDFISQDFVNEAIFLAPVENYQHNSFGLTELHTQLTPTIVSITHAREQLRDFLDPYSQNDILAIQGKKVTIEDTLLITLVQSQVKNIDTIDKITDDNVTSTILEEHSVIVLIGSEKRNNYTKEIFSFHDVLISSYLHAAPFMIMLGHDNSIDKEIIVIFTTAELYNLENKAAERSPLSGIIDKRYIPMAATITSVIALYLWNIFGNSIVEFFFDFTSEKVQDRQKEKKKKKKETIRKAQGKNGYGKQLASIILAVLVFSTAMSWTWSSQLSEFFNLFIINLLIIGIIFSIREILRIYISKKKNMKTIHVFWPFGSLLTIGSTVLGNTFSLASYNYYENKEDMKKYGQMYFFIFLSLYLISVVTFILNFLFPSIFLQMVFVFTIMSVFIDMTPLDPMDGYEVRIWNFKVWIAFYILVALSYLIMNFQFFI
jgi:hypothetical protein